MTSKSQATRGYTLPTVIAPEGSKVLCVTIPDDEGYKRALFAQLISLGKWWNWEKTGVGTDNRARDTAQVWRNVFTIEEDCNVLDCAEVEACLSESEIIANLQAELDALNGLVDDLTELVDELGNETLPNDLPPLEEIQANPDALCGGAYKIADELIARIDSTYDDASVITLGEWLDNVYAGSAGFNLENLVAFWGVVLANLFSYIPENIASARDEIAEAIYCANGEQLASILAFEDTSLGSLEKNVLTNFANTLTFPLWYLWLAIGSATPSDACEAFCPEPCTDEYPNNFVATNDCWENTQGEWIDEVGERSICDGGGVAHLSIFKNFTGFTHAGTFAVTWGNDSGAQGFFPSFVLYYDDATNSPNLIDEPTGLFPSGGLITTTSDPNPEPTKTIVKIEIALQGGSGCSTVFKITELA